MIGFIRNNVLYKTIIQLYSVTDHGLLSLATNQKTHTIATAKRKLPYP